jgi:hypothetical protein
MQSFTAMDFFAPFCKLDYVQFPQWVSLIWAKNNLQD